MFGKKIRDGEKVHEWVVDILKDRKVEYLRVEPGPYICFNAVCFSVCEAGEDALYGSVDAGELGNHAFKNKKSLKKVIAKILEGGACDEEGLWASLFELTRKLDSMPQPVVQRRGSWVDALALRRRSCAEPMQRKNSWVQSLSMRRSFLGTISMPSSPTSRGSPMDSPLSRNFRNRGARGFLSSESPKNGSQDSI